ncbi:sugar phosphate isomerase/epimerase [Larkinella arboricola]|uniref:Sugar phosphate isomerase/epimerase n=1 Tax=Larkinella arboricola TaxID=643671 RepID=A0A327WQ15_LARAB|nr:TIM barrel protein [Larkinella arboricola]RAJ94458.1 sugar phosphate isomerase/epimerase [Larkinella arboricola]
MELTFFAPAWGNTLPFDQFCRNVKAAGYDGVEMALPFEEAEKSAILDTLAKHGLQLIGQYFQSFETDLDDHARNYEKYLRHLSAAQPVLINCQTGKDFFTFEQNQRLFELADRISGETGVKIIHETHRGKALFAAHITRDYLQKLPQIRLTLDISHWCNVHESLLENQTEAVQLAIQHTDHIHSRVGHPEGPQVNDPRAPEWAETLNTHLAWWDQVVARHRQSKTALTVTTEFGPATYLPVLPYTQMPVASQWDVNVFMLNLLKNRYSG